MDSKKKISIALLASGFILIAVGVIRLFAPTHFGEVVYREDTLGLAVLSIGAVMAIFATGAIFDESTDQ